MRRGLTCSPDDSSHQLEDKDPACLRDLDEANEFHFIGGNFARSNGPIRCLTLHRSALAVLKTARFLESMITFGTNAPPKIVVRNFPIA